MSLLNISFLIDFTREGRYFGKTLIKLLICIGTLDFIMVISRKQDWLISLFLKSRKYDHSAFSVFFAFLNTCFQNMLCVLLLMEAET